MVRVALLWAAKLCAAANKMDSALCQAFICTTKSFVGNVAETEIIVGAILDYFHGTQRRRVAQ